MGLNRLRSQGETYLLSLTCCKCETKVSTLNGHQDLCSECVINEKAEIKLFCNKHIPNCTICKKRCEETSIKLEIVESFFFVNCFFHKESKAEVYEEINFVPLCEQCEAKYQPLNLKPLDYLEIQSQFFNLFNDLSKILNSDIKRGLMSESFSDLIKSTQFLIQVKNGPFCKYHPWNLGEFWTENWEIICEDCKMVDKISLQDSFDQVKDSISDLIKYKDSFKLSKFLIQSLKIMEGSNVRESKTKNLFILEALEWKNGDKRYLRCVSCVKNLTVGLRKGIKLDCGHLMCFNCVQVVNVKNCPIENNLVSCSEYLEELPNDIPICHYMHKLDPQGSIFKLQCFHYSCGNHLNIKYCRLCGFDFQSFTLSPKPSKKLSNLIEYLSLACPIHNLPISSFSAKTQFFYCNNCNIPESNISSQVLPVCNSNSSFITSILHKLFENTLTSIQSSSQSLKRFEYLSTKIMKIFDYSSILRNQILLNLIQCLRVIISDIKLFNYEFPSKDLKIFKNASFHSFEATDETSLVLSITPISDIIITHSMLNPSFFQIESLPVRLLVDEVQVKVFDSNKNEIIELGFESKIVITSLDNEKVLVKHLPVYACAGLNYVIIFKILPGVQALISKMYSKNKVGVFDMKKYWGNDVQGFKMQACMGGFFYGVKVVEVGVFLNKGK